MKLNVIFVITVFLVSIFFWIGIFYCLLKVIKKVSVIYRLKSWTGFEQNETINNVNRLLLTINLFIDGANKTNIVIKKKIVTSMRFTHCNVNFIATWDCFYSRFCCTLRFSAMPYENISVPGKWDSAAPSNTVYVNDAARTGNIQYNQ